MAVWAYECRSCPPGSTWWVSRTRIDEVAPTTKVLRVQVGTEWRCAIVDRSQAVAVEQQLLHEAIASDPVDCPECVAAPAAEPDDDSVRLRQGYGGQDGELAPEAGAGTTVQAAAISLAGHRLLVVLVPMHLVESAGEAEMLVTDLRPRFGGVDVVLMGQDEDGSPRYHGDAELLVLLAGVPVDRLPWKVYPIN
jgi:hypothetical protein